MEADTHLKRCLYGLNDAARQLYYCMTECLTYLGCEQSPTNMIKEANNEECLSVI